MTRLASFIVLLFLAAACTSSSDDAAGAGGSSGSGGSGNGGASGSGNGGTGASGGSAGTSGGSGGSSAGSGGSTAGTGGSTAGNGGSSGASGSGGTGGAASDRCAAFCATVVAGGCADGPTQAGCQLTCEALSSASACRDDDVAYFDCVEAGTVMCNAQDKPYVSGCGTLYLKAIDCAVSENPNPSIVDPCSSYCSYIAAESCPNNASETECNSNCLWFGATGTGCDDEWLGYLQCANQANWACIAGYAVPGGCGQQYKAYSDCINAIGN